MYDTYAFMFPGTAALFLAEHSWLGSVTNIERALARYLEAGDKFTIKSRKEGNHHYQFIPGRNGWLVKETKMRGLGLIPAEWLCNGDEIWAALTEDGKMVNHRNPILASVVYHRKNGDTQVFTPENMSSREGIVFQPGTKVLVR